MSRNPELPKGDKPDHEVIGRGYKHSGLVGDRFGPNELAENYVDLEAQSVEALELEGSDKRVYDIAASDGRLSHRLRFEFGMTGPLIGVEPNSTQSLIWQYPIETKLLAKALDGSDEPSPERLAELEELADAVIEDYPIQMIEGDASYLDQLEDNSADVIYARNFLYYLTQEEREEFYAQSLRVLGPDGVAVIATSDDNNKPGQRRLEHAVHRKLKEKLPDIRMAQQMNTGYTTRDARRELVQHFDFVYALLHRTPIMVETPDEVRMVMNSLRAMLPQYSVRDGKPPNDEEFDRALNEVALPYILDRIKRRGAYRDMLRRSEFIVSNKAQDRKRLAKYGFHVVRHADSLEPPTDQA